MKISKNMIMNCTICIGIIALLGAGLLTEDTAVVQPGFCDASLSSLPTPAVQDFHYVFNNDGILEETGSMDESKSNYFWLNSGARMTISSGIGETVQGALPGTEFWRLLYALNDPLDTDNGFYPQNLFRLITKNTWDNVEQSVRFKLVRYNRTDTPNRDEWSGILLMSHYQNQDNLYYAGIRADGNAVIKKKCGGVYTTLATIPVFTDNEAYDRNENPNLLPLATWIGIKSIVREYGNGSIGIELWLDEKDTGTWKKLLTAWDIPSGDASVVAGPAYAGIRTDYFDVQFDDYHLQEL